MLGSVERPVVEERPADDVFSRNKSPIARIETVVPVVAHHEIFAGGNHQVAILDDNWENQRPMTRVSRRAAGYGGTEGNSSRKSEWFSGVVGSAWGCAWATPLMITMPLRRWRWSPGTRNEALDQEQVGIAGLEEHDNVAALRLAVVDQRHPFGRRRERDAIDDQMIAHQQGLLHRTGGDDEVLGEKGEDEQAHDQHGTDAGCRFKGRFFDSFPGSLSAWPQAAPWRQTCSYLSSCRSLSSRLMGCVSADRCIGWTPEKQVIRFAFPSHVDACAGPQACSA